MKPDIHPNYRQVVFQDLSSEFASYALHDCHQGNRQVGRRQRVPADQVGDISSHSHPFYTGKQKTLDTGGRVDKFRRRYAQK